MGYVNTRNVQALGAALLPHVQALDDPALSPEISPALTAPVFLIHGADDNVVPAIESRLLAARLRSARPVTLLVSPLITHAEVDQESICRRRLGTGSVLVRRGTRRRLVTLARARCGSA